MARSSSTEDICRECSSTIAGHPSCSLRPPSLLHPQPGHTWSLPPPITCSICSPPRRLWLPVDFSPPAVQLLFTVQSDGREVQLRRSDQWMAHCRAFRCCISREAWLYTPARPAGVLLAQSPPAAAQFLASGCSTARHDHTGSRFPPQTHRFTSYYPHSQLSAPMPLTTASRAGLLSSPESLERSTTGSGLPR